MKNMLCAALALAGLAVPAAAAGPTLWQNVEAGMSVEDVHALYPLVKGVKHNKSSTVLKDVTVGECTGDASIAHKAGVVTRVEISGTGCGGKLFRGLVGKYGEPMNSELKAGDEDEVLAQDQRIAIWREGGRVIRYKGQLGGLVSSWELRYEPVMEDGL